MKFVNKKTPRGENLSGTAPSARTPWKILLVDDEKDIRTLSKLNLKNFSFANRGVIFLEADSAKAAKKVIAEHPDIAFILIDIVMETDDAGLKLVEYIRKELKNTMVRLVIRTGQPGMAPERYVIDHFDIDDYKDKTELTAQKLYTTTRAAIKSYRDLKVIDNNRNGLKKILDATPKMYQACQKSINTFFNGMLTQIVGLCDLDENSYISTIKGMIATIENDVVEIQAGTGDFENNQHNFRRLNELKELCSDVILHHKTPTAIRSNALITALKVEGEIVGFIYLEPMKKLSEEDRDLINIFTNQCSSALESLQLHFNLHQAYDSAINMLAEVAEFKDSTTGEHINRLINYTEILARELGIADEEAVEYGKAARLHDIGKVGIPDNILQKPGKLTKDEFEIIKTHTTIGAKILRHSIGINLAKDVALYHHERWDGKGYPTGTPSSQLPLVTRIVAVADVFDALISIRHYKSAWPIDKVIATIRDGSGTQFDPQVVDALLTLYERGQLNKYIQEKEMA